ncbi:hypothetical protein AVEN_31427-1 [Araneus ventricosus]|nr:hypothetical protein AVEN_31427-1 [Araneus ventricosus]
MEKLQEEMDSTEYKKFSESYFTIRRKDRAWSEVAPDMIIEKCLMKSMKIAGGVTQGRGMEDFTLSRWVSTCPVNMKAFEVLEEFCEKSFVSSEQHVEFRPSRESRDDSDLVKLSAWLLLLNLLNAICPKHLSINIGTGLVADNKTNYDNSKDVGEKLLSSIAGGSFGEVKLQRKKKSYSNICHK